MVAVASVPSCRLCWMSSQPKPRISIIGSIEATARRVRAKVKHGIHFERKWNAMNSNWILYFNLFVHSFRQFGSPEWSEWSCSALRPESGERQKMYRSQYEALDNSDESKWAADKANELNEKFQQYFHLVVLLCIRRLRVGMERHAAQITRRAQKTRTSIQFHLIDTFLFMFVSFSGANEAKIILYGEGQIPALFAAIYFSRHFHLLRMFIARKLFGTEDNGRSFFNTWDARDD